MSSPDGTGNGGDRCSEMVASMIDFTYKIGPWTRDGTHTTRDVMFEFTRMLNNGSDVSAPENADWIDGWLRQNTSGQIRLYDTANPTYSDIVLMIERGHVGIGGFNDYISLRLANGAKPYAWNDPHGLGHVLLIVGYNSADKTIAVHDPLLKESLQPSWYSWAGFQAAGFADLAEVNGPALPIKEQDGEPMLDLTTAAAAQFFQAQQDGSWKCTNGHTITGGLLAAYRAWPAAGTLFGLTALGLPTANEVTPADKPGTALQPFERGVLVYDPQRTIDHPEGATGPVYLAHTTLDPQIAQILKDNGAFQQQIADLKQKLAVATAVPGVIPPAFFEVMDQLTALTPQVAAQYASLKQAQPKPNVTAPLPAAAPASAN